jgi:hypothetical protein
VGLVAENRVTDIVKMRDLGPVEYYAIFKLAGVTKDYAIASDNIFADITTASYLAIVSDPGRTFNGRAVFDDGFVTDIDPVADEGSAKQTSVQRRIEAELEITGDLLQNIPDLGRVIEERSMLCLAQVEVVRSREHSAEHTEVGGEREVSV